MNVSLSLNSSFSTAASGTATLPPHFGPCGPRASCEQTTAAPLAGLISSTRMFLPVSRMYG